MSKKSSSYTFKILLLGDGAVGKTSLVQRFVHNSFQESYLMTIGMEPSSRYDEIDGVPITYSLWDIAGSQHFTSIRSMYYRGVMGALVIFDKTRPESLENIRTWIEPLRQYSPDVMIVLVGNKNDLPDQKVSKAQAQKYAKKHKCLKYIETSAKTGEFVGEAFHMIGRLLLDKFQKEKK